MTNIRIKLVASAVETDDKGAALVIRRHNVVRPLGLVYGHR